MDLCRHLADKTNEIAAKGNSVRVDGISRTMRLSKRIAFPKIIPEVDYQDIVKGLDSSKVEEIKASGTLVVRGVVPEEKVCH